ncbi:MAG: hypothetical protein WC455_30005 [Dehalococcoidia bacterium]|jgi:hypothetical protein
MKETINGRKMYFRIGETIDGRVILIPKSQADADLLKEHKQRTVEAVMTNPLNNILVSCENCTARPSCNHNHSGTKGKFEAANCKEWFNPRVDDITSVSVSRPHLCQKCGGEIKFFKVKGYEDETFCDNCDKEKRDKIAEKIKSERESKKQKKK